MPTRTRLAVLPFRIVCDSPQRGALPQQLIHHLAAAGILVAHEVAVGVPRLHRRLVAEKGLEHLDGLSAADLRGGEVVAQVVGCGGKTSPTGMVRVEDGAFGNTKIGASPRLARDS